MTVPTTDTPPAAIEAAIAAEASFYDQDKDLEVPSRDHGEHLVRHILAAAAPLIAAAERERCAQLAEQRVVAPTGWFAGGLTSPGWETRNALRQLAKLIRQQS
jgi:hypothetical protein